MYLYIYIALESRLGPHCSPHDKPDAQRIFEQGSSFLFSLLFFSPCFIAQFVELVMRVNVTSAISLYPGELHAAYNAICPQMRYGMQDVEEFAHSVLSLLHEGVLFDIPS
jgi:hypothetical protein